MSLPRWISAATLFVFALLLATPEDTRAQSTRKDETRQSSEQALPAQQSVFQQEAADRVAAWPASYRELYDAYRTRHSGTESSGNPASGMDRPGPLQRGTSDIASFATVSPVPGTVPTANYTAHVPVQLSNGNVAVFFLEPGESSGELFMVATDDAGVTWSSRTSIANGVFGPVRAVTLGSGRLVVAVGGETGVMTMYSDDSGATWTDGPTFNNGYGQDLKVTSSGAALISFARYNEGFGLTEYLSSTSTDGVTWTSPQLIIREVGGASGFGIFDATIVEAGNGSQVFAMVTVDASGLHLETVTSADGISWGSPSVLVGDGSFLNPIPTLAYTADGTVWLIYSEANDLYFVSSSDNGASWSAATRMTIFQGLDYWPSATVIGDSPIVTFSAARGSNNETIWIAEVGGNADTNPDYLPPAVELYADIPPKAGVPFTVEIEAIDETGIASVDLTYTVGTTTSDPISAVNDGSGADAKAGDSLWTAQIPPMDIGTTFTFTGIVQDTDGNVTTIVSFEVTTIGAHIAGNVVVGVPGGRFAGVEWPAGSRDNYLFSGGLWVGAKPTLQSARVTQDWAWMPDDSFTPTLGAGVSDEDITVGIVENEEFIGADKLGLTVVQRSYQWAATPGKRAGEENALVVAFDVTNNGSTTATLEDVQVGLWLDADITTGVWFDDVVAYDSDDNILYMYDSGDVCNDDPQIDCPAGYFGVALINDPTVGKTGGTNGTLVPATATCGGGTVCADIGSIGPFNAMKTGINSNISSTVEPADYQMLIVAPSFTLATSETKTLTFALAMGDGYADMAANMNAVATRFETSVGIDNDSADIASGFELSTNYPNPFSGATRLDLRLAAPQHVRLTVHDLLGREVAVLLDETVAAGSRTVAWDASHAASGVFMYRAVVGDQERVGRMVVVR